MVVVGVPDLSRVYIAVRVLQASSQSMDYAAMARWARIVDLVLFEWLGVRARFAYDLAFNVETLILTVTDSSESESEEAEEEEAD